MSILETLSQKLESGKAPEVKELTQTALDQGFKPQNILDDGLIAGMNAVGDKFRKHEIFLPHVLLAAKAMYAGLDLLKPLLLEGGGKARGKIVLGTVKGDLHDLGKNLVGIMLKGAGFDVIDLGKDVLPETFINTALNENAGVIGMSALLTTTMPVMKEVIQLLKERGLSGRIKTIVGGAPLSESVALEIGADAYAYDAGSAVDRIKQLLGAEA